MSTAAGECFRKVGSPRNKPQMADQSSAGAGPQDAQTSAPSPSDINDKMRDGNEAFRSGDFSRALAIFNEVISKAPENVVAHNMVGNCSLRLKDYPAAATSFQRALELQPDELHNISGLIEAYALGGQAKERDTLRAHINELEQAGKLPQNYHYIFDAFTVGEKNVQVVEFLNSTGKFHYRYHFNVVDGAGKTTSRIALESDDIDQGLWAKTHAKEAAAGQREFSLDGYAFSEHSFTHSTFRFYDGEPSYDQVCEDVKKVLTGIAKPTSSGTYPR